MSGGKERFREILSNEKNEIEELKKIISDRGSLTSKIKQIKNELGVIETALREMDNKFYERIKQIEKIDDEIKLLNFEIQSEDIDTITHVIKNNLPEGFGGVEYSEENDKDNLKNIKLYYNSKNKTHLKKDKDMPIEIGKINILVTEDKQFKVEVTLGDKMDSNYEQAEFFIPNFYRIYKIIAWINTNLHYNE